MRRSQVTEGMESGEGSDLWLLVTTGSKTAVRSWEPGTMTPRDFRDLEPVTHPPAFQKPAAVPQFPELGEIREFQSRFPLRSRKHTFQMGTRHVGPGLATVTQRS